MTCRTAPVLSDSCADSEEQHAQGQSGGGHAERQPTTAGLQEALQLAALPRDTKEAHTAHR